MPQRPSLRRPAPQYGLGDNNITLVLALSNCQEEDVVGDWGRGTGDGGAFSGQLSAFSAPSAS